MTIKLNHFKPNGLQEAKMDLVFLREKQVLSMFPISAATLWRWVNRGHFPKPIKLSGNVTAWKTCDVQKWIVEQQRGGL